MLLAGFVVGFPGGMGKQPWGISGGRRTYLRCVCLFSFIRTVTVGSGVSPDLRVPHGAQALAGFPMQVGSPPVGTFTPP